MKMSILDELFTEVLMSDEVLKTLSEEEADGETPPEM